MDANEILRSSYLDLLFDKRNKAYGGYELRRKYAARTRRALLWVIGGTLVLVAVPVLAGHFRPAASSLPVPRQDSTVTVADFADFEKEPEPEVLPVSAPPPPVATIAQPDFVIVDKQEPQEDIEAPADQSEAVPGPATTAGAGQGTSLAPGNGESPGDEGGGPLSGGEGKSSAPLSNEPLVFIDKKATFRGDLSGWLRDNLQYPAADQEAGNEGKVIVEFIVELDGSLSAVRVFRSSGHPGLDAEALRAARRMPSWNPGTDKNKPVRSLFRQPVTFRIQ